ncbi:HEPN domain-containing protein [Candidatus Poribacteria bacterium]|jgi:HEPN domain-containing protein/predicted nucleotidyltransferase|nr:HEPN domain-containing protein [Candidatus Poribacteria bacterium]MBT5534453.1 HEPN domain-containing protein [Candidatus Poribacteria bacterium]MBT5710036.1 HEPN domain-containing protein [Candidatus Poribacteria bacterium]MBT7100306.1 HEPN domain-containing protein [Candidatus Poribacteria bacterium]MBT7808781.1 HEPN domain-containing protein [Candidatus Poribacteria bacterium]
MQAVKTREDAILTDACDAIRSTLSVRAIYLFGSRARGDARPDSDHDMLIVAWDTLPDADARLCISDAVGRLLPSAEMHYATAGDFEWRRRFANTVERGADREGLVLYMANDIEERYSAARSWFAIADRGVRLAALALGEGDMSDEACFHAQQAVEKCLKGYLTLVDREAQRTHQLDALSESCAAVDPAFGAWAERLRPLSPYAVEARYPDGRQTDIDEAREAVAVAQALQAFVGERVRVYRGGIE